MTSRLASLALIVVILMAASIGIANAQFRGPVYGGGGGEPYEATCGPGGVLIGFTARSGAWLDSVQLICRRIAADGRLGDIYTAGKVGGDGGEQGSPNMCPDGFVGMSLQVENGRYVNGLILGCLRWNAAERKIQDDPRHPSIQVRGGDRATGHALTACPNGWAVKGIYGKAGQYVDNVGVVCNDYIR